MRCGCITRAIISVKKAHLFVLNRRNALGPSLKNEDKSLIEVYYWIIKC